MNVPFLFLSACLLLWGWQTGYLLFAIPMALVLESSRFVHWRWEITRKDFYRLSDFSSVLLTVVVLYQFNKNSMHGVYFVLEWLPFVFFLLLFIQRYSQLNAIPYSAFFISMRKQALIKDAADEKTVDFNIIFALITVLAACAGNQRSIWFFAAICALIGWILFLHRSKRYSVVLWISMILLTFVIGYFGQTGMRQLQRSMERVIMSLLDEYFWQNRDPGRTTTAIGSLGRFKLSENIRIRVDSEQKLPYPFLLQEASYNYFNLGIWSAQDSEFELIDPERLGYWPLSASTQPVFNTVTISTWLRRALGVVPMPQHSLSLEDPGALEVQRSRLGAVRMEGEPGLINYRVQIGNYQPQAQPNLTDLLISDQYLKPIMALMNEEGLMSDDKQQVVNNVNHFFKEKFRYQLVDRKDYPGKKSLMNFLLHDRRGHCEYFATSTVLMLRAANIPARYAIGYSIQEYSEVERRYIARARHSHAWVSAYVDGVWQIVDTTPASWDFLEQDQGSDLQALVDLYSWLRFLYAEWQQDENLVEEETDTSSQWLWLLLPLIMILIWRLSRRQRLKGALGDDEKRHLARSGMDSEFFTLMQQLQEQGYLMNDGESVSQWLQRIRPLVSDTAHIEQMLGLLPLHNRYRFDPAGISPEDRLRLRQDSRRLL